jgi:hypothetical protein
MGSPCSKLVILLIGCQTTFNNIESKSKKGKKLVQRNNQPENSQMDILFQLRLQNIKIGRIKM